MQVARKKHDERGMKGSPLNHVNQCFIPIGFAALKRGRWIVLSERGIVPLVPLSR